MKNWDLKKWSKKIAIILVCLFAYLGTGYQIAKYSWWLTHTPDGLVFLQNDEEMRSAVGITLWPISMNLNRQEFFAKIKNPSIETKSVMPLVLRMEKRTYIFLITVGWLLKLAVNVVLYVIVLFILCLVLLLFLLYSFGKFLWILISAPFAGL